jgi:hypothetical protein
MDPWAQFLLELIKIGGTLIAVWLATVFAIQKFHRERAWDRKEKNYTEIMEALNTIALHAKRMQFADMENEEDLNDIIIRRKVAEEVIGRVINTGGWYVSQEILKVLREMRDERFATARQAKRENLGGDFVWLEDQATVVKAIRLVREHAMTELESMKSWMVWSN